MTRVSPVRQMRLAVTTADYAEAVEFYRDVLGLRELGTSVANGGAVTILDASRATLELASALPPNLGPPCQSWDECRWETR